MEGDGDLDCIRGWDPLSEIVSLERLLEPPDLREDLLSGLLNFLCNNASIKLCMDVSVFASFYDNFPHHEGIVSETGDFQNRDCARNNRYAHQSKLNAKHRVYKLYKRYHQTKTIKNELKS